MLNLVYLPIVVWVINFLLAIKVPSTSPSATLGRSVPVQKIVTPVDDGEPWGVAKQIGDVTWRMKVGEDAKMATPGEIASALNIYRSRYGSQILVWDDKLANYAKSRATYFNKINNLDGHAGFKDFLEKEDGFNKLGFNQLGENASIGYRLSGVHLIEWIYAGDEPHDKNQLNNIWNYVGIGVEGTATAIIFGTGKF